MQDMHRDALLAALPAACHASCATHFGSRTARVRPDFVSDFR
jgi:hypothetical protein